MTIIDQYGRPFKREALSEPQTARLGWVSREYATHPSRGLTPYKLHQILQAAEQGDICAQADLFSDMEEKDAHIYAEMSKRKRSLLGLSWSIEPPRGATAAEKRDAQELEEWLRDIDDMEDVILDALDAIGHGFSAQSMRWERANSVWLPASIDFYAQRFFQALPDDGNALRLRNQSLHGEELWPFGWILHEHKAKTGYLTRGGLHRVLAWPYLFKNYSVRDLAEFLEIYGIPIRMGTYPSGSGKEEQATLLSAITSIGHNAAGIMPEGMKIEIIKAADGEHDPFLAMVEWAERSVSKAILGGTLTSQADGKTSTNALGNVHNEVRHELTVSDARQLSSTLTRDLVYPIRALNQNNVDPRRRFRFTFDTRELADLTTYAEALPKLVGVGFRIPAQWAEEQLGIPQPVDDKERILAVAAPAFQPIAEASTRLRRAALTADVPQQADDDAQRAIDAMPLPESMQPALAEMLRPVIELIQQGADAELALDELAQAFPDLDSTELEEMLARAFFVADLLGHVSGKVAGVDEN